MSAMLADIKHWVGSLESWRVSHVHREANAPADWIASEGGRMGVTIATLKGSCHWSWLLF